MEGLDCGTERPLEDPAGTGSGCPPREEIESRKERTKMIPSRDRGRFLSASLATTQQVSAALLLL